MNFVQQIRQVMSHSRLFIFVLFAPHMIQAMQPYLVEQQRTQNANIRPARHPSQASEHPLLQSFRDARIQDIRERLTEDFIRDHASEAQKIVTERFYLNGQKDPQKSAYRYLFALLVIQCQGAVAEETKNLILFNTRKQSATDVDHSTNELWKIYNTHDYAQRILSEFDRSHPLNHARPPNDVSGLSRSDVVVDSLLQNENAESPAAEQLPEPVHHLAAAQEPPQHQEEHQPVVQQSPWVEFTAALEGHRLPEIERLIREYPELLTGVNEEGKSALHVVFDINRERPLIGFSLLNYLMKKGALYTIADRDDRTIEGLISTEDALKNLTRAFAQRKRERERQQVVAAQNTRAEQPVSYDLRSIIDKPWLTKTNLLLGSLVCGALWLLCKSPGDSLQHFSHFTVL